MLTVGQRQDGACSCTAAALLIQYDTILYDTVRYDTLLNKRNTGSLSGIPECIGRDSFLLATAIEWSWIKYLLICGFFNNNLISVISRGTVRIALIEWVKRLKVVSGGFQFSMTGSILRFG